MRSGALLAWHFLVTVAPLSRNASASKVEIRHTYNVASLHDAVATPQVISAHALIALVILLHRILLPPPRTPERRGEQCFNAKREVVTAVLFAKMRSFHPPTSKNYGRS